MTSKEYASEDRFIFVAKNQGKCQIDHTNYQELYVNPYDQSKKQWKPQQRRSVYHPQFQVNKTFFGSQHFYNSNEFKFEGAAPLQVTDEQQQMQQTYKNNNFSNIPGQVLQNQTITEPLSTNNKSLKNNSTNQILTNEQNTDRDQPLRFDFNSNEEIKSLKCLVASLENKIDMLSRQLIDYQQNISKLLENRNSIEKAHTQNTQDQNSQQALLSQKATQQDQVIVASQHKHLLNITQDQENNHSSVIENKLLLSQDLPSYQKGGIEKMLAPKLIFGYSNFKQNSLNQVSQNNQQYSLIANPRNQQEDFSRFFYQIFQRPQILSSSQAQSQQNDINLILQCGIKSLTQENV
eukprot:403362519